jgi:ATP-binding cassette, subfamily A (ABC1), member 3
VKDYVTRSFQGAVLKEEHADFICYHITTNECKWSKIFEIMEDGKKTLGIEDYSLGQTSLEQVFLFFTKYQREEDAK